MDRYGDGYRRVLDNNEYKIKDANSWYGWMARHEDGCRQGKNDDTYNTDMIVTKDKQSYRNVSKEKELIKNELKD